MRKALLIATLFVTAQLSMTYGYEKSEREGTEVLIKFREDILREMQDAYISVGNDAYFWISRLSKAGRSDLSEEINNDMRNFMKFMDEVEKGNYSNQDVIKVTDTSQSLRLKWINKYRHYL